MNHWERLGELLVQRRVELGYPNRSEFARVLNLKHTRVLSDLELAKRTNFDQTTLTAAEVYYEWEPGSIAAVLHGLDPKPMGRPVADVEGDADPRLNNIERQIDQLWQRIEQLERTGTANATASLSADAEVVELPRHKPADAKGPDPTGLDLAADETGEPSEKQKQHTADHGDTNQGR